VRPGTRLRQWLTGRRRPRRWAIVTAAPAGAEAALWGDTWFAQDLAAALRRLGEQVRVVGRRGASAPARDEDDVVLVLRGLRRVHPRRSGNRWLLWVISHPDLVQAQEPAEFDAVFAASAHWPGPGQAQAVPLLQATNPDRFHPGVGAPDSGEQILFVGSTRGGPRPIVADLLSVGLRPAIYGLGWDGLVDPSLLRGDFLANEQLPAAYASAGLVLNDHWPDMAAQGFLSNRLFDAVATGTRVISDEAVGLAEVFGDLVRTYREPEELLELVRDPSCFPTRAQRVEGAMDLIREHSFDRRAQALVRCLDELPEGSP